MKLAVEKLERLGYCVVKNFITPTSTVFLRFTRVTDGQTDACSRMRILRILKNS